MFCYKLGKVDKGLEKTQRTILCQRVYDFYSTVHHHSGYRRLAFFVPGTITGTQYFKPEPESHFF